MPVSAETS